MEQGRVSPPLSSPDTERTVLTSVNDKHLEEGTKGYYSINRPTSPYPNPTQTVTLDASANPSFWGTFKKTFGLGGKRRTSLTLRKKTKGKKTKGKKTQRKRRSQKRKTTQRKSSNKGKKRTTRRKRIYGGANNVAVQPYESPMDFARVQGIPTAIPHDLVG
jgi:hypothetical protein